MSEVVPRMPAIAVGIILCALGSTSVVADSIGPLTPTGVIGAPTSGGTGNDPFVSPGFAIGSDNVRATATTASAANNTEALVFSFLPGIPAGATIDGVELFVEGQSGGSALIPAVVVAMSVDGGSSYIFFPNSGALSLPPGPADLIRTFGSTTDDWLGITASELNSALFRSCVAAFDIASGSTDTYSVDDVSMTVHFTPAGAPTSSPQAVLLTVFSLAIVGTLGLCRIKRNSQCA